MKQMNELKESSLLSGELDIRLLIMEGDSQAYPSSTIVIVKINVVDSPVLAYSESTHEAFYYITELIHTADTFDEFIKLLNDDEYSFKVVKDNLLPSHTLRDEILDRQNSLYEQDKVMIEDLENITIGDLVKMSPDYNHLHDILFETGTITQDDERFNYKIVWDDDIQDYVVKKPGGISDGEC
jgi:hypothetical protein